MTAIPNTPPHGSTAVLPHDEVRRLVAIRDEAIEKYEAFIALITQAHEMRIEAEPSVAVLGHGSRSRPEKKRRPPRGGRCSFAFKLGLEAEPRCQGGVDGTLGME